MKVLVFDVWGDYAHFKKFYTTSSPLTFSFPPPSTVKGMLGAIIGVNKDEYLEKFSKGKCKIGVKIINPVHKIRLGLNHINTKGGYWIPCKKNNHEARTQIRTEFLRAPKYRIYVFHKEKDIVEKIYNNLIKHESFYTLSLGLSELLANYEFKGVFQFEEKNNELDENIEIGTVIPVNIIKPYGIEFEEDKKYYKERIPIEMNSDRVVEVYEDVVFEAEGRPIKANVYKYWEDPDGERITFF